LVERRKALVALTLPFCLILSLPLSRAESQPSTAEKARVILETNCFSCHGETAMAGLDLRQRDVALKGGGRGPALIPGNAQASLLYKAVAQTGELKMPMGKPPLSPDDLATLQKWINEGAAWVGTTERAAAPTWWSFKTPQLPAVPEVKNVDWVRNPVDAFILQKLEERGLQPAPSADKRTLIRRAYFDLLGLPPAPDDVKRFLDDHSPQAWTHLVDELLASPHYGERWGKHWLDAVRYADSSGYETDFYYKDAWRYRDYVVKSFNEDKPYDRFVQEQVAGDELWPDDLALDGTFQIPTEKLEHLEAHVGTGVYTLGPQVHESNMDGKKLNYESLTDAADLTGAVFMGITMGCARCHNHKFDPITQRDYYSLQAVFAGSQEVKIPVVERMTITDIKQSYPRLIALHEARTSYELFRDNVRKQFLESGKSGFSPEAVKAYEVPDAERTAEQERLAAPVTEAFEKGKLTVQFTPQQKEEQGKLYVRMAEAVLAVPENPAHGIHYDGLMEMPTASVLGHREPPLIPDVYILNRGDLGNPKEKVLPALPAVLSGGTVLDDGSSALLRFQDRKKLALWLTRPDHPLTSRVMVNRIWEWHFGRGIVDTPNDFGKQGQPPSHPELLDWLATQFVAQSWSIKSMQRLIMLSNTYQMASLDTNAKALRLDPENRLLWRMNRQRLEGETLWDSIHAVAGTLNPKMGGTPVTPPLTPDEQSSLGDKGSWPVAADPSEYSRRGIYILLRRNFAFPMFEAFDRPDNAVSCPKRDVTNVAPQALWTLNNRTAFREAMEFAARLVREEGPNPPSWIERGWNVALARPPTAQEKRQALRLMDTLAQRKVRPEDWKEMPNALTRVPLPQSAALVKLCLTVFNLNEFAFID
jgi:cytochrome c553